MRTDGMEGADDYPTKVSKIVREDVPKYCRAAVEVGDRRKCKIA